jgi:hypothetical protein
VAQLSEWLQLMTAEIARKQEDSLQARAEQQRRGTSATGTNPLAAKSEPARQAG